MREGGVQWAVTTARVNPDTGKTTGLDIQFVAKRNFEMCAPVVARNVGEGVVLSTDCAKIYPGIAKEIKASKHLTVNHSEHFRDPETGCHTNNVEGMHRIIKHECLKQFNRQPLVEQTGRPIYLDLVSWRCNHRLEQKEKGEPINVFRHFLRALLKWVREPIEDFDHRIPLIIEDNLMPADTIDEIDAEDDRFDGSEDMEEEDQILDDGAIDKTGNDPTFIPFH